jgi:uncharacterized protein YuzE
MKPNIEIEYRTDMDMLYIKWYYFGVSVNSKEIVPGIVVDFCRKDPVHGDDLVLGIEVEDASKLISILNAVISRMRENRLRVLRLTLEELRDMCVWNSDDVCKILIDVQQP